MKARDDIPNLINGVSQQAPAMRLKSQAEASLNLYPTTIEGLTKRPATEHLAFLPDLADGTFTHFIVRDNNERYVVAIFANGSIRVWDWSGNEKTVNNLDAAYLSGLSWPETDLRALTVNDYTFVVNKNKTVLARSSTSPTRPYEALINVIAGNYGKRYKVIVNGVQAAVFNSTDGTNAADSVWIDTATIANTLQTCMTTVTNVSLGDQCSYAGPGGYNTAPWTTSRFNSTVYLKNDTTDFSLSVEDGYAGRAMTGCKASVQKFTDLPNYGPDGFKIKVIGSESNAADDYWVEFQKTNNANSYGIWKETVKPGARLGLDATTMPHILVRESDGSFTFKAATWDDRKCGDETTVEDPSFVGDKVQDVFFHKNRLGLLTRDNTVMSESGKFFNFYRKTLTALLDTDPVDTGVSTTKVTTLRHAVTFQKELLVFSDTTQFVVKGNELLTPKTVNADPISDLMTSPVIRPEPAATSLYFVTERNNWATVLEYSLDKQLDAANYEDVTAHVPAYIPAGVRYLVASSDLDFVALTTSGDPTAIFIYKYTWNGNQKLQSAWSRWTFAQATKVVNMVYDKGFLKVLFKRAGGTYFEQIALEQRVINSDTNYSIYLDRKVSLTSGTFDGTNTNWALPYAATSDLKMVTSAAGVLPAGVELKATIVSNTVSVKGNYATQAVLAGYQYDSRHSLSTFYKRNPQTGASNPDGRLQIYYMTVMFARSAYFRVEITPQGRGMRTYPFTGKLVSDSGTQTGALGIQGGSAAFPVMSRNDRVKIELVNDTWRPSSFTSLTWDGNFNPNTKEL